VNPVLNPHLSFGPLDADACEGLMVCEVPEESGSRCYSMPADFLPWLQKFDGTRSLAEAVGADESALFQTYSARQLEKLVQKFFLPTGILLCEGVQTEAFPRRWTNRVSYLTVKKTIFPARIVFPVAKRLSIFFHTSVAVPLIVASLAIHFLFYWKYAPHGLDLSHAASTALMGASLLGILGGVIHEFGHATALVRYGGKRPSIGGGLYLVFGVLYADLSEAWRLKRMQRAVIDAAGIYFQTLFGGLMFALLCLTGNSVFLYAFFLTDLTMASNLNPFLRMDGYWLMADLSGVVNLRYQTYVLFKSWLRRGKDRPEPGASVYGLSRWKRTWLALYALSSVCFFVYLLKIFIVQTLFFVLPSYPAALLHLWQSVRHMTSVSEIAAALGRVFWSSVFIVGILLGMYRLVTQTMQKLSRRNTSSAVNAAPEGPLPGAV
jgi:putative peptide zinc metalloprotease protein